MTKTEIQIKLYSFIFKKLEKEKDCFFSNNCEANGFEIIGAGEHTIKQSCSTDSDIENCTEKFIAKFTDGQEIEEFLNDIIYDNEFKNIIKEIVKLEF